MDFEGNYMDTDVDLQRSWSVSDRLKFEEWEKAAIKSWISEVTALNKPRASVFGVLHDSEIHGGALMSVKPKKDGDELIYSSALKSKYGKVMIIRLEWIRYRGMKDWQPVNRDAKIFDGVLRR